MRPAPQSADQARDIIAEIRRVNSAKRAVSMIARFVQRDGEGRCNWSPEARAVWQSAK